MPNRNINKFFLSIIAPSILAIMLFIISFFAIIIPQFEKGMMTQKKKMIRELTNSAWSIMQEQNQNYQNGVITLDSAKHLASHQIELMRYGIDRKDYFWIIDAIPTMIMHPYRKELNGCNLTSFTDSHEKKLFVDASEVVKTKGEGFVNYYWQWKDDTSRIVPKLSYVKGFKPWNWIIGTGIYLDDVKTEIASLKNRLLTISSIIVLIIALTLFYIIKQSLSIENKRKAAENKLILSKQKYKTLVQASTEGTLMFINGKVVFNNLKFAQLIGRKDEDITGTDFNSLFATDWNSLIALITDPKKTITTETELLSTNQNKEIIISVSRVEHSKQEAYIVVTRDISKKIQLEKSTKLITDEIQGSLLLMNQPIKQFVHDFITCTPDTTIQKASEQMLLKNQKVIFISQNNNIMGAVNDADIRKRAVAANLNTKQAISSIMSSPVIYISSNSLLYEAVLLFKRKRISHLLIKDKQNNTVGAISNQDVLEMQRNSVTYLIQEIESSYQIEELKKIYNRLAVIVNTIITNSDNAERTTHIITSVADAITKRVIELAVDKIGIPPCKFAFMAMGSEGRMEQTLKTDQDNALIYEDTENNYKNKEYFLSLAEYINKNLHKIGYNFCKGEIMAMNPNWCMPLSEWKKQFSFWVQNPDPKSILDSSIFFDLRHIFGDAELINKIQELILSETNANTLFFHYMADAIINYKPSINDNSINFKKVLLPIVGFFRIYSLKHQLVATNTIDRLEQLKQMNVINAKQANELIQIYNFLMQKRLKKQSESILNNEHPNNLLQASQLSVIDKNTLKKALNEINTLQLKLRQEF